MIRNFLSRWSHSNVRPGRARAAIPWAYKMLAAGLAIGAAAWGGAQWQSAHMPSVDPIALSALDQRLDREASAIEQRMAGMATKLGELQARLIVMDSVRQRVTDAAGLSYSAPELIPAPGADPALAVMDDIVPGLPDIGPVGSAEALGRDIDLLRGRVSAQEDAYTLIDAAMSGRAGLEAGLPTTAPVDYPYLSSSFGWRRNPVSGRHSMHEGLDFVAPRGAPIYAASGGIVLRSGTVRGYGKMIEIDHGNGLRTRYAHASTLKVRRGEIVQQGQEIARVGNTGRSTGAHLHFEVRMADFPLDPSLFLRASQDPAVPRLAHSAQLAPARAPDAAAPELR